MRIHVQCRYVKLTHVNKIEVMYGRWHDNVKASFNFYRKCTFIRDLLYIASILFEIYGNTLILSSDSENMSSRLR